MINVKLKKLFGIIKSICNHFKGGGKIDISLLNEELNKNGFVRLEKNQELTKFYCLARIKEIKENGQLIIGAGKDNGIFEGCYFDFKNVFKCLVVSANNESCIAEMQPKKEKHIDVFSGVTIEKPFYPHINVGDDVGVELWKAL